MSFSNVGRVWSEQSFREYLAKLPRPTKWSPKAICLHHTAAPSLATRPDGLTAQHIINIRDYYSKRLGWSSGPHLFTDDDDIFGMTPLHERGVHAVSFNSSAIGIEALGHYDIENPLAGRGLHVWTTTAAATKALVEWLGISIDSKTILFHRDDQKTSKTCPGTKVLKMFIFDLLASKKGEPIKIVPPIEDHDDLVAAAKWLVENKGYSWSDTKRLLKKRADKLFYFGEEWLEGARYDATAGTTLAPLSELVTIPRKV
jgi:hypothetical protein